MKQEHLAENELQQLALVQQEADDGRAAHLHECAKCAAKLANYRVMFSALQSMEKPAFSFDVENQVMAQLPMASAVKSVFPWTLLLLSAIAVIILGTALFEVRSFFKTLFKGTPEIVIYIIVVTALTIIIFQCREIWASYRKKMNLLKFY